MERRTAVFLLICALLLSAATSFVLAGTEGKAAGYRALEGVKAANAVYDMRGGDPKAVVAQLKLIRQTNKDIASMTSEKPMTAVVFLGPSVKLISKNREGFSAEDMKYLDEIAGTVSMMSRDGIRLEI